MSAVRYAPKFEDRSQEETLKQERCARRDAWDRQETVHNVRGSLHMNKATFFLPSEMWCLSTPSSVQSEEREFVVDSGAHMHMLSKKDSLR